MSDERAELVIDPDPRGFLRATASRHISLKGLLAAVDQLEARTKGAENARVLVDLSIVQPPGPVEQAIIGEHIARQLSHCCKVASVVAPGTKTGISERVARRLNLELRVFTCEADAVAWLAS